MRKVVYYRNNHAEAAAHVGPVVGVADGRVQAGELVDVFVHARGDSANPGEREWNVHDGLLTGVNSPSARRVFAPVNPTA